MAIDDLGRRVVDAAERFRGGARSGSGLNSDGGDGTSGGVTDDWKASVDRQLGQLHGDVRALLNRGVAAIVALAFLIGGLYLYTNDKFDAVSDRLSKIEVQQAAIGGKIDTMEARLTAKLDAMDRKSNRR